MARGGNGRANCILQVCCRSGEAKQAMADQMVEDLGCDRKEADEMAGWIDDNFDLAPKGSLTEFKNEIARLAREASQGSK